MAVQQRNAEMVNLLRADFIHKQDTVYLSGILAGSILMLPGLVAFWPMNISVNDDNTLYADRIVTAFGDAWDLGDYTVGTPVATGYVTVNIDGNTYYLIAHEP